MTHGPDDVSHDGLGRVVYTLGAPAATYLSDDLYATATGDDDWFIRRRSDNAVVDRTVRIPYGIEQGV